MHGDGPFGIVSLEIAGNGTAYPKIATAAIASTDKITLTEFGQAAKTSLQSMAAIESKTADAASLRGHTAKDEATTKPNDSLPQIRELDQTLQAQNGYALRSDT